jgi:hypothetical protein
MLNLGGRERSIRTDLYGRAKETKRSKVPVLYTELFYAFMIVCKSKIKLSHYAPWRRLGGEEVQLLLILNLGTRWG